MPNAQSTPWRWDLSASSKGYHPVSLALEEESCLHSAQREVTNCLLGLRQQLFLDHGMKKKTQRQLRTAAIRKVATRFYELAQADHSRINQGESVTFSILGSLMAVFYLILQFSQK